MSSSLPDPTDLDPSDWTLVRQLFDEALQQPEARRLDFLLQRTASTRVVREVAELLAHHTGADQPPHALAPQAPRAGQLLGAWRLGDRAGSGGMGEVFEAQRADGSYEAKVAVKLLARGRDSQALYQRFERERAALARLDHPHIARLLDAGVAPDGAPYFVMEWVDGKPLDEATRALDVRARIALFVQLCEAVSHAHRNLLVHRDLKPSNVLVTTEGQIKLLDFGIAKALNDDAALTREGERAYTPHYAAPEQVRGEAVTTATDVYSLGVLLYVALTGVRPYGRGATTPLQAAQAVLEESVTKPSALSDSIAQDRAWASTQRSLAGDIDNIVLKALHKEPHLRYVSADALADDLRAHLDGRPVSARAPTFAYLAQRFVQRNVLAVALSALAVVSVLGGAAAALWQAREARLAQRAAQSSLAQVQDLTQEVVLRFTDAIATLPKGQDMQITLLDRTGQRLEALLKESPNDPDLMALAATTWARLAEAKGNTAIAYPAHRAEAQSHAGRAMTLAQAAQLQRPNDWRLAFARGAASVIQAQGLRNDGKLQEAVDLLNAQRPVLSEALARAPSAAARVELLGQIGLGHLVVAQIEHNVVRPSLGRPELGLQHALDGVAAYERALADEPALRELQAQALPGEEPLRARIELQLAFLHGSRARSFGALDQLEPALQSARRASDITQRLVREGARSMVIRDGSVGESSVHAMAALRSGKPQEALRSMQHALGVIDTLIADQPDLPVFKRNRSWLQHGLAWAQLDVGQPQAALDALDVFDAALASDPQAAQSASIGRRMAHGRILRAHALAALGRPQQALPFIDQALAIVEPRLAHPQFGREYQHLAARALAWRARFAPTTPERGAAQAAARSVLEKMQIERPLAADQAALLAAVKP